MPGREQPSQPNPKPCLLALHRITLLCSSSVGGHQRIHVTLTRDDQILPRALREQVEPPWRSIALEQVYEEAFRARTRRASNPNPGHSHFVPGCYPWSASVNATWTVCGTASDSGRSALVDRSASGATHVALTDDDGKKNLTNLNKSSETSLRQKDPI